jgi:hypothetical protein
MLNIEKKQSDERKANKKRPEQKRHFFFHSGICRGGQFVSSKPYLLFFPLFPFTTIFTAFNGLLSSFLTFDEFLY